VGYQVVFDISERIPDVLLAVPATAGVIVALAALSRPAWRFAMRRSSGFLLAAAGLPWLAFHVHNTGGLFGLALGGGFAALLAAFGAFIAAGGGDRALGTRHVLGLGSAALAAGALIFGATAAAALEQSAAFGLQQQLDQGRARVVAGKVEDHLNANFAYECFSVEGQRFCYSDGPTSVGFHQTSQNGGPIRDGLEVRVTFIGNTIVRLEVAEGR
jgi:hypothetical protein